MSGLALILVLGGALLHATWNLAANRTAASGVVFVWLAAVVSAVALAVPAVLLIIREHPGPGHLLLGGLVSGGIHTVYFLLLQWGYRLGDVSIVYPLARGTGPLLSVLGAVWLLGERPDPIGLIGAVVLVGGVLIISLAGGRGGSVTPAAVGAGLSTGVAIAGYTLWDSHAVLAAAPSGGGLGLDPVVQLWASFTTQAVVLTIVALVTQVTVHHRDSERRTPLRKRIRARWSSSGSGGLSVGPVLIVGIGSPSAYLLILEAFRLAPVALVAPGREVSVVLVSLAGWLWLHEPHPRPRLAGAGVVVAGIVLLALG